MGLWPWLSLYDIMLLLKGNGWCWLYISPPACFYWSTKRKQLCVILFTEKCDQELHKSKIYFSTKISILLKITGIDFSGGLVAKTPKSQCREPRFHPWSGNKIPYVSLKRSYMPQQKSKISSIIAKTQHSQINSFFLNHRY